MLCEIQLPLPISKKWINFVNNLDLTRFTRIIFWSKKKYGIIISKYSSGNWVTKLSSWLSKLVWTKMVYNANFEGDLHYPVFFFNVWLIMLLQRWEILHRQFYSRQFYHHMRMHVWLHSSEPSYEIHVRWYTLAPCWRPLVTIFFHDLYNLRFLRFES